MKIDNTVVNEHIVDNGIQELKNVRVLARSTSFYQLANVRMRNLFYKSGKPGRYVLAMKSHLPNIILIFMNALISELELTQTNNQYLYLLQNRTKQIKDKTEDNFTLPMIDFFLNESNREDLKQMDKVMKDIINANFPVEEIGKNFSSLFNLLWPSSLPCHAPGPAPGSAHLLQRCVLHGQELDCARLFRPVATDRGICCSFNHRNVLRDSSFSRLLRSKQHGGGDGDDELHLTDIGKTMGLQVFVDQHSNRVSAGSVSATSK